MLMQRRKTGDDDGEAKDEKQKTGINLYHIPCNYCGVKVHYAGKNECSTQTKLKEDVEAFRKIKKENLVKILLMEEENKKHW